MSSVLGVVSLEPWDDVWRRNQHLAHQLVRQGLVESLVFVEPPGAAWGSRQVEPAITVVTPHQPVPKRLGGLQITAARLARRELAGVDALWINAPDLGVHLLGCARAVYDVTDDWRTFEASERVRRRVVAAEDALAREASTVVCSRVLERRWRERYGVEPVVVLNGVDLDAVAAAVPRPLDGPGPHVGYVGTLHSQRLDLELVLSVASLPEVGTLHLVGPDSLTARESARLSRHPAVRIHPPVSADQVPTWTKALNVLLSPHLVSEFTLSLDAIKSYEYLAARRPVVATPTSGFQLLRDRGVRLAAGPEAFAVQVRAALIEPWSEATAAELEDLSWTGRARAFAEALGL